MGIDLYLCHMARIKVDLHDIYNNSKAIDKALLQAFEDAIDKKIREVEIIPGKGSGQLRKKPFNFFAQVPATFSGYDLYFPYLFINGIFKCL